MYNCKSSLFLRNVLLGYIQFKKSMIGIVNKFD